MARQYRFSSVLRLSFRVWLRNLIPFTFLSVVLSLPLVISLQLDGWGHESTELIYRVGHRSVVLLVSGAVALLLTPMITHRVLQSIDGVESSLICSIRLSVRGVLAAALSTVLVLLVALLPVLGVIGVLCLVCIWFVAVPAAIAERLNPLAALGRSAQLIPRRPWTTIGVMLAVVAIATIPRAAVMFAVVPGPMAIKAGSLGNLIAKTHLLRPYGIALVVISSALLPFHGIVRAVSYVLLCRDGTGAHDELAEAIVVRMDGANERDATAVTERSDGSAA